MICPRCQSSYGEVVPCACPAKPHDPISHPPHYVDGRTIEPIEAIMDWQLGYCLGNVVKYVSRAGRKGPALVDLQKARFYLGREIARLEKESK